MSLEDLNKFEAVLQKPGRSTTEVGVAIADLTGILAREDGFVAAVSRIVSARARVIRGLMGRLEADLEVGPSG
jgi:hypothetical protein